MPTDVGSARAITLLLVDRARTNGDARASDSLPILAAFEGTCRQLSHRLGASGVRSLLTRALSRAQAEHPILTEVSIRPQPGSVLVDLDGIVHRHGAYAASRAIHATLDATVDLLGDLIGIDVVARLLAQDTAFGTPDDEDVA